MKGVWEEIGTVKPREVVARTRRVYGAVLTIAWGEARGRMTALGAGMVVLGLMGAVSALLSKQVVDAIVARDGTAFLWGVVFLVQFAGQTLIQHGMSFLQFDLGDRIQHAVDRRLMEISAGVPGIEHLERPEFADKVKLVREHRHVPFSVLNNMNSMTYMFFGMVSSLFLLGSIHALLVAMPLIAGPASYVQYRSLRKHYRRHDQIAPEARLAEHYLQLATEPKSAKEIRVFGLGPEIVGRHQKLTRDYIRSLYRDRVKRSGIGVVTGLVHGVVVAGAIGFIGYLALDERASLGEVVMGVQLARQVMGHIAMTSDMVAWLAELSFMGERYLWLLDYKPAVTIRAGALPAPARIADGIRFESVTFTYPGTDEPVLREVDLLLPAGSTVALVGENGAGKTSIVKLLSRFYDPTSGRITVDGVDLAEIDLEDWRARISVAFQDFVKFQFVARESVGVGDLSGMDDATRVARSATLTGADLVVDRLPRGWDQQLGRDFTGGVDLSDGEWQRVALARGSMRPEPAVVVLDEPTASLDAKAEHEVFERFADLAAGRRNGGNTAAGATLPAVNGSRPITLLVSHRFSTVRMADLIVVLHEGTIEEYGTHDELVGAGGRYAELFAMQASRYD